jgi:hypothetical protein
LWRLLLGKGDISEVPGDRRAYRLRQLRGGLALCLAVLLALTPLAQLFPSVAPQAALAASAPTYAPDADAARGDEPALGLQDDRRNVGILPRLPHLEGALAPLAQKVLLPKLDASINPFKPEKARLENDTSPGFHRSSVGTARTPTGPPA